MSETNKSYPYFEQSDYEAIVKALNDNLNTFKKNFEAQGLLCEKPRQYGPYDKMRSEILGLDGVSDVNIQENGTARFDPYTQIPAISIRVIVEADINLKTKKVAKAIENWKGFGVGLTGNTSVEIKVGPKGNKTKRCVKFEWVVV